MSTRFSKVLENTKKLPKETETALEVAPSPEPLGKTGRRPGKKTSTDYVQVTVYLEKSVHTTARKMLFDHRKQFSDLVNELVSNWITESDQTKPH